MNQGLKDFLEQAYTPYQAAELSERMLLENGFKRLERGRLGKLNSGGKHYLIDDGTIVAFTVEAPTGIMAALSHTDSPALKIKGERTLQGSIARLNCENYGGAINYSFFDIPLKICGRVYVSDDGRLRAENVVSPFVVTIPSLSFHQNREVNDGFKASAQSDLAPLLGSGVSAFTEAVGGCGEIVDADLFACPAISPYESGLRGEFLSSPRIDNLTGVYATLTALIKARPRGINVCACFNGEETGSGMRQGAAAEFFPSLLKEIYAAAGGKNFDLIRNSSLMLSVDNAHAVHPAHPEKSDPENGVRLNGGIVIKRHSRYATDAASAAAVKTLLSAAGLSVQNFYNNSDLVCGSTVGPIVSAATGIRACDVGIAQLAMHSAVETCGSRDPDSLREGVEKFFSSAVRFVNESVRIL